jgi:hypothetical protein
MLASHAYTFTQRARATLAGLPSQRSESLKAVQSP